jgi:hypothetical protein
VGQVPGVLSSLFAHAGPLVDLVVAPKTQSRHELIRGLNPAPLPVLRLVGVRRHYGSVLRAAELAGNLPAGLEEFF